MTYLRTAAVQARLDTRRAQPVAAAVDLVGDTGSAGASVAAVAGIRSGELPAQDASVVAAALVGAIAESLVGPLAGARDPATVPTVVTFALRSLGVRDAAHA